MAIQVSGIGHVVLKVRDLERSARFDHRVSQSLTLTDPDGYVIELYVDADPAIWRDDPAAVASGAPLAL